MSQETTSRGRRGTPTSDPGTGTETLDAAADIDEPAALLEGGHAGSPEVAFAISLAGPMVAEDNRPSDGAGEPIFANAELRSAIIRDYARDDDGEIARDEQGRPLVEERALTARDILGHRIDGDGEFFILADGRRIRVIR